VNKHASAGANTKRHTDLTQSSFIRKIAGLPYEETGRQGGAREEPSERRTSWGALDSKHPAIQATVNCGEIDAEADDSRNGNGPA